MIAAPETLANMTGRAAPGSRIPITLLTGFLGSGKTTILNRLLQSPEAPRTAVIVNELGEVGLDHLLITSAGDGIVELSNGCICCTVRSDLAVTLSELYDGRNDGIIAPFKHVMVETTGLALPAPILEGLLTDVGVAGNYCVNGVATAVDAVNALPTLARQIEAIKQVTAADLLLLTKLDLVGDPHKPALRRQLHKLNPGCPIVEVIAGAVEPAAILNIGTKSLTAGKILVEDWMGGGDHRDVVKTHQDYGSGHRHDHAREESSHLEDVVTRSRVIPEPIPYRQFLAWTDRLRRAKGSNLLRLKGIVNIAERPGRPLVIHAVQEIFHPPTQLERWPSEDHRTRIVMITRNIARSILEDLMQGLVD